MMENKKPTDKEIAVEIFDKILKKAKETPLAEKIEKFHAECLDVATSPDEDMLIKTIFGFVKGMNKESVAQLKEEFQGDKVFTKTAHKIIDRVFGRFE